MEISAEKSKILVYSDKVTSQTEIEMNEEILEEVNHLRYIYIINCLTTIFTKTISTKHHFD